MKESLDKNKKTILVVEDEHINYLLFEEILTELNYNVIHAKDGATTLSIIDKKTHFDLILMDIKLPDINGYDLTKKVKKSLPEIPIIAQTAYAMEADKNLALKSGCDDYISKPIDQEKLVEILNKFLKKDEQ